MTRTRRLPQPIKAEPVEQEEVVVEAQRPRATTASFIDEEYIAKLFNYMTAPKERRKRVFPMCEKQPVLNRHKAMLLREMHHMQAACSTGGLHDKEVLKYAICELPEKYRSMPVMEFSVGGQRYVRITEAMDKSGFRMSVTVPRRIELPVVNTVVTMTLIEGLAANNISIKRRLMSKCMRTMLLTSDFLIHAGFFRACFQKPPYEILEYDVDPIIPFELLPTVPFVPLSQTVIAITNGGVKRKSASSATAPASDDAARLKLLSPHDVKQELAPSAAADDFSPTPSYSNDDAFSLCTVERAFICAMFDTGVSIEALANATNSSTVLIRNVLAMYSVNLKQLSESQTQLRSDEPFIAIGIILWRFFQDCANKQLRLSAVLMERQISKIVDQLGLADKFSLTDEWFNKFVDRHKINFDEMTAETPKYYIEHGVLLYFEESPEPSPVGARIYAVEGPELSISATQPLATAGGTSRNPNHPVTVALRVIRCELLKLQPDLIPHLETIQRAISANN